MKENPIYKFLKENNLTNKSEDDFLNEYSSEEKANELYSFFTENKLTEKDFNSFYSEYLKKKDLGETSSTDSKLQEEIGAFTSNGFKTIYEKGGKYVGDQPEPKKEYVPDVVDVDKSNQLLLERQKREQAERAQRKEAYLDFIQNVKPELEERIKKSEEQVNKEFPGQTTIMSGGEVYLEPLQETEAYKEAVKKNEYLVDARDLINKSENYIKSSDDGILKSMFTSPLAKDYFSFGANEISRGMDILEIAKKVKDGKEISDEEQTALFAYGFNQEIQQNVEQGLGSMVGGGIVESIPFMIEFALSGGATASIKETSKKFLTSKLKNAPDNLLKKYAINTLSSVAQTSVRAVAMEDFYRGVAERQVGSIEPVIEDGKLKGIVRPETMESPIEAATKSYLSSFMTVAVENFGAASKGIFDDIVKKVPNNPMVNTMTRSTIDQVKDAVGFQGWMAEFSEEVLDAYGQAAVTGDKKLSEVWDNKQMLATLISTGLMSGGFSAANYAIGGNSRERTDLISQLRQSEKNLNPDVRSDLNKIINTEDVNKTASGLDDYLLNKISSGASSEEIKNILDYVGYKTSVDSMNDTSVKISEELKPSEVEKPKDEQVVAETEKTPQKEPQKATEETTAKQKEADVAIQEQTIPEGPKETKNEKQTQKTSETGKEIGKEMLTEVSQEDLPENVIRTKEGLFELNEEQTKQRKEMIDKYGRSRADELITDFIDVNDLRKYDVEPGAEVKQKIQKENAEKIKSGQMRGQGIKEEGKGTSDKNMPVVNRAELQDRAEKQVEKTIETANSINDLNDLVSKGKVKVSDKTWQQKMEVARKNNWYDESDIDTKELVKEQKRQQAKLDYEQEISKPKEAGIGDILGRTNRFLNPRAKFKEQKPLMTLAKKYLGRTKGMSDATFKEAKDAEARVRLRMYDISKSVKDVAKNIQEVYGEKLSDTDLSEIQKALESVGTSKESLDIAMNTIAKNIPAEAWPVIKKMRAQIDSYSKELSKLDMIGVNLEEKIDKNTGYYLTRTYKKHTDRDWVWSKIPQKIKDDAAEVIYDLYPEMSKDETYGYLKSIVESNDVTSSVLSKGSSLTDIDKGILKKRSKFLTDNPEIRALLGENKDPFYNYAVSLTKMAEMIERGKMLENMTNIGISEGWLSENPSERKNHITKIEVKNGGYPGKPGTKKISDFYTTPEMAEAIGNFMGSNNKVGNLMRVYMKVVTGTKIAKTAGSVKGLVRNFKSNMTNSIANANWNVVETSKELISRYKTKESKVEFTRELIRKGVIGDSANVSELTRNVQDLTDKLSFIMSNDESIGEKTLRKSVGFALKAYGFADDVWKTYRYVSEYKRYFDAYKKIMPEAEALETAKNDAVSILHKTSTYYSELPLAIQNMRKLPFTNTFISFPYLTLTNYIGTWETAIKEVKNPVTAHIGVQRMAGSVMALSVLGAFAAYVNHGSGQDEKDIEAWRRFLPDFWRNDVIAINKVENDVATYSNISYMDYYGVVTTPLMILFRRMLANGEITSEDMAEAVKELSSNFISWDIVFSRMNSLIQNRDMNTGYPIWNEMEDSRDKAIKMIKYSLETIEPGTATDARRIYREYREGGEWEKRAMGVVLGNQQRDINPMESMDKYKLWDYKEGIQNSIKIYKDELRKYKKLKTPNKDDDKILNDAKIKAEKALNGIVNEIRKDLDAMTTLSINEADNALYKLMKEKRFDKDVLSSVFWGKELTLNEEGSIVTR